MEIKLLSVIVPIYKQEKTIKSDLLNIHKTLKQTPYKFEIIGVIDGHELDNSMSKANELKEKEIKVFGYKTNHGKGQAIRYGMQKAKGDIVTFIDSGGDINPLGIVMLLEHMKWYGADVIVGSKLHPASKVKNYPILKTKIYYWLTKLLFKLKIRDTQTGLKAYKKEVLQDVLDRLVIKRFGFDIEILSVANRLGYKNICDAPVEINYDAEKSTYINKGYMKTIMQILSDTLAVWYRMHVLKYYDNGRKRKRVFDKELDMWINTGGMTDKRQYIIDTVNRVHKNLYSVYRKITNVFRQT
jgi:dolichol-phosphate mannosyltransferase